MMKGWKQKRMNDFVWFQRGFDLPKAKFENGEIPVYGSTSILGYHNEAKVSAPGIITGRSGTLGVLQYAKEDFWPHNTTLWVKDFKGNNESFVFYMLQCLDFSLFNSGGAVPTLNRNTLNSFLIDVPPLPTQRKIAGILSAYDDLIENNLKRIKLLEEKAQLTYEEWFVRMKFPGHETTPINEGTGLPEGWEEKPLGEYCKILKGKNITKSTINEGNIPVVAGGLLPAYYHDTSNTISPVITVSASGANAGFTNIYLNDIWASDCSYIDSTMTKYLFFIYALMIHNQQKIYHFQKGAAQPHVYPKDLARLESIIPTENLQQKFNDISKDIFSSIRIQRNQNQLLKEARDILLPRLMTGMIDVDKIKGVS